MGALLDPAGIPTADPGKMAVLMGRDLGQLYEQTQDDEEELEDWLGNVQAKVPSDIRQTPTARRLGYVEALERPKKSSPGPDGIPFGLLRVLRCLIAGALVATGLCLEKGGSPEKNHVCLK